MTAGTAAVAEQPIVNWNSAWQEARKRKTRSHNRKLYWNRRAPSFADHARKSRYSQSFMEILAPEKHWSVLDVGCGAGTLALPLSQMVNNVTAIDFSEVMIRLLKEQCITLDRKNIQASVVAWEDDWQRAGIKSHDVAIASRSLTVDDLGDALEKLHQIARHRVVLSSLVDDGPFDRQVFEAIGRELDRGPDYIYVYNMLHQMGIYADVTFIVDSDRQKLFSGLDEAVESYHWMIDDLTDEEAVQLRNHLKGRLIRRGNQWALDNPHVVRWAVISWDK